MAIKFRIPAIKVDKYPDNSRLVTIFSSINFFLFSIKSIDFIDCYRMLSIIDFIDCKCQAVTHSPSAPLPPFSGAPTRAKRACDSAILIKYGQPLSFSCHVIDWAYLRTNVHVYRLYGWGRGDYQKEGRGVSGVSCQVHIFYIGHSQYGQLTAVKTG